MPTPKTPAIALKEISESEAQAWDILHKLGGLPATKVMLHSDLTKRLINLVDRKQMSFSAAEELIAMTRFGVSPEMGPVPPMRTIKAIEMLLYKDDESK